MDQLKVALLWSTSNAISGAVVYPLDTMKTNLQLTTRPNLNLKTGAGNLFSGLKFYFSQRFMGKFISYYIFYYCLDRSLSTSREKFYNYLYASFVTAIIASTYSTPLENAKILYQVGGRSELTLRRCRLGIGITFIRDFTSIMSYFPVYESLKGTLDSHFIAGGLSGVLANFISYPFDSVKTHVQRHQLSYKQSIALVSFKQLYSGLHYCMARSFIAHGLSFYFFSLMK